MYRELVSTSFRANNERRFNLFNGSSNGSSRGAGAECEELPLPQPPANLDSLRLINSLRQLCNHPALVKSQGASNPASSSSSKGNSKEPIVLPSMEDVAVSGKLDAADRLLAAIRRNDPTERVAVISNFTSTLDVIAARARVRGWELVRLDGKVQQDQRQS